MNDTNMPDKYWEIPGAVETYRLMPQFIYLWNNENNTIWWSNLFKDYK